MWIQLSLLNYEVFLLLSTVNLSLCIPGILVGEREGEGESMYVGMYVCVCIFLKLPGIFIETNT